jgi:hypothetical protein
MVEPQSGELLPKFVASLDPEWIDEALAALCANVAETANPVAITVEGQLG